MWRYIYSTTLKTFFSQEINKYVFRFFSAFSPNHHRGLVDYERTFFQSLIPLVGTHQSIYSYKACSILIHVISTFKSFNLILWFFSHGTLHRLNTERYVIGNPADRLLFIDLTLFHLWFLVGCRIKPNSTLKTRKQFFEPVLELNRTPRPVLVFFIDTRIIRYYYVLKIDKPYLYIRWIRVFFLHYMCILQSISCMSIF